MATTPEIGLELPIGVTDQKAIQSVVRMVGRAEQEFRKLEQSAVKSNAGITRSFTQMSNQSRAQIQNVSFQLQDVFVQIASGTAPSRALAQQLPQLASGFGALGAVLGTVAAVAIPLAAQFINLGGSTEALAEATEAAEKALGAYREALENSNVSATELADRFGNATGAARQLLDVLVSTSRAQALIEQREVLEAIQERFSGLQAEVAAYNQIVAEGVNTQEMLNFAAEGLQEKYGLAVPEAQRLAEIVSELNDTTDANQRNALFVEMAQLLEDAAIKGSEIDEEMVKTTSDAAKAGLAVAEIDSAANGASASMAGLADEASRVAMNAMEAAAALGRMITLNEKSSGFELGKLGGTDIFSNAQGYGLTARMGGPSTFDQWSETQRQIAERRAAEEAARRAARRGGAGRKRGGGGAKDPYTSADLMESAQRELTNLERQLELLGKSAEQVETLRAKWHLLDEAKRRGLTVDEGLTAEIDRQSAAIGKMVTEYERAAEAADFYADMNEQARDGFIDTIVEGESLAGVLGDVAKAFAKAALQAALFGKGPLAGGMDGLLSGFGGLFGGFRASGGPVSAGKAYVVGERGPEPFVPAVNGRILSVSQAQAALRGGQGGSTPKVTINNNAPGAVVSADYVTRDEVILTVTQAISRNNRGQSDRQYLRGGR